VPFGDGYIRESVQSQFSAPRETGCNAYQNINLLFRPRNSDLDQVLQVTLQLPQLLAQPKPHIGRNLLIPTAPSVQLPADILADDLAQPPLVGGVDILVVGLDLERAIGPLLLDLLEARLDGCEFFGGEDAIVVVCAGEGHGAGNVFLVEYAIIGEGGVVLFHDGIKAL
jgi:hypothetical protein